MEGLKRKLNVLSIEEKMKILRFLDGNPLMKKNEVATKFGIPASTLSTIIKNRNSVQRNFEDNKKVKKSRKCTFPDIDECVRKWFVQCRDQRVPVSGMMLQRKADDFAKELGHSSEFKASNGWLESFKSRHDIVFRKLCGESASVPQTVCEEWIKELSSLLEGYEAVDVFNADETGLFFQCLPNRTATFAGEECRGGKQSKVRVTVLLAANEDGSEKLPPLMIGRYAKPRCFSKVKSFPITYKANKKAWMTSEIFSDWLKGIDKSMGLKKRKILLFVDNCNTHSKLPTLKNVTVKFLPPNTTSKLQPLDQGIIRSFKVEYRRELVRKLLDAIDEGNTLPTINVLDAMRMTDYAWRNVTQKTIKNCFLKAGFQQRSNEEEEEQQKTVDMVHEVNSEEWEIVKNRLNVDIEFESFLDVDDSLATCGMLTDAEIIDDVRGGSDDDDEIQELSESPEVSTKEAEKAIQVLRTFLESQEDTSQDGFTAISTLQKIVQSKKVRRQTLLTHYFC